MQQIALSQAIVTQVIIEGNTIITSQSNGHIYIFKSVNEKPIILENDKGVWALAASKTVFFIRLCIATFEGHTAAIRAIHLVDDSTAITASRDNTLRHWDLRTGSCIRVFTGHENGVRCSAVHGELLVSGSRDNTARVWTINDGKCLAVLKGHQGPVYAVGVFLLLEASIAQSVFGIPLQGDRFVSGSVDGDVCVWNMKDLKLIHKFSAHAELVKSLAVDDGIIVSRGDDGVKVWDLVDAALLKHLEMKGSVDALTISGKKGVACAREGDNAFLVIIDL
ncbi:hypothetical protein ONS96_007592 [Cadophora gregata f. sp. sojae]|nr:hypothetical protein ONS96_007592 [Cadophora gregata f. sp. sojae]